ncbi:methyltransferase domain-containing protein [Candidatus Poribacteria bacterium]|nr:methyltransferase domain-containing protein [Candidatus Poribacteria bacterium]
MHASCCRNENGPPVRSRHLYLWAAGAGAFALGVALLLLVKGASFWLAAPVALVAAHLVILALAAAGFAGAAAIVRAHTGGGCCDGVHAHEAAGGVLHSPRFYNFIVGALLLGGEGRLRRWILRLADIREGAAVLDAGSGTGSLLRLAAEQAGPHGRLCGVEPSPEMVTYARARATQEHLNIEFDVASADAIPHPDASFDVVFCTFVVHHLPASMRPAALREMCRVLKPGGRLLVAEFSRPRIPLLSPAWLAHFAGRRAPREGSVVSDTGLLEAGYASVTRHVSRSGAISVWVGGTQTSREQAP